MVLDDGFFDHVLKLRLPALELTEIWQGNFDSFERMSESHVHRGYPAKTSNEAILVTTGTVILQTHTCLQATL